MPKGLGRGWGSEEVLAQPSKTTASVEWDALGKTHVPEERAHVWVAQGRDGCIPPGQILDPTLASHCKRWGICSDK